jgi:hypothetical protein
LLEVRDGALSFGRVGLLAGAEKGVEFDDVSVRGDRSVDERFTDGRIGWRPKGGDWSVAGTGRAAELRAVGPPADSALASAKLVGGQLTWTELDFAATLTRPPTGRTGLVFRYVDEARYDELAYDPERRLYELVAVRGGKRRVVETAPERPGSGFPRRLGVRLASGIVLCRADGRRIMSRHDPSIRPGKAGLFVARGATAAFGDFAVRFPREKEPVLTLLQTFARESTMVNWAAARSDWQKLETKTPRGTRSVSWNRGAFPGGGTLRATTFFSPARGGTLRIFTCGELTRETNPPVLKHAYEVVCTARSSAGRTGLVKLFRNDREVASADAPGLQGNVRVSVKRVADHVLVDVGASTVIAYKDEAPLDGWTMGCATETISLKPEDVDVLCPNTLSYSFVKAPADWRFAGGEWLVTNRWRCDPRWSFFGGESKDGVAAIWNKTIFKGDLTLEFAAGIRHQRGRGGYARHASDMNAVICGDGRTLNSGYGFIFGGWGNKKTAITRNGRIVAECDDVIPARTSNIHRRWFYVKIVKRGATLRYYVDNKLVLEYTDPDPLDAGQVALWTWRNGLMVARVRIAPQERKASEPLAEQYPEVSRCVYDG